jgi:O-antigen ligase
MSFRPRQLLPVGDKGMSVPVFPRWVAAVALVANVALALVVTRSTGAAIALAAAPAVVFVLWWLMNNNWVLVGAALALPLGPSFVARSFSFGGAKIFPADVLLVLGVGSWLLKRDATVPLRARRGAGSVLGLPFLIFATLVVIGTLRGHYLYGSSLLGVPVRLALYAAFVAALWGVDWKRFYPRIVVIFYAGIVWKFATAMYYIATGGSETPSTASLSTGGERLLAGTTTTYLACALFLAVLNLRYDRSSSHAGLHLTMAILAFIGVVLGFTRTTFISVALILPFLLFRRTMFRRVAPFVPLLVPIVLLSVFIVPRVYPTGIKTFSERISVHPANDLSIQWRRRANAVVWEQVHESPITGVGFGRTVSFIPPTVNDQGIVPTFEPIQQDAHNGQLWLLAGGGVLLLASFWLLLLNFALDLRLRFREARETHELVLLQWAGVTVLALVLNTFTSPTLGASATLATLWTMLVLPMMVISRRSRSAHL